MPKPGDAWLTVNYSKHCVAYVCAGICARVYCNLWYIYDVFGKKLMFAISSPGELLVTILHLCE